MFAVPNLLKMKKRLLSMLSLALIFSLSILGCSPDSEVEETCSCEKVTYIESKYQEESTNQWLLNYVETSREQVECQDETNYSIPPTGSVAREVFRIECE